MNPRKPPRLATWLLNRLGLARQNPPLLGDLLEEFGTGKSAAWFWRQTLGAIWVELARHARILWRPFTGTIIGWAIQTGVAFVLWRVHFPPYLPLVFWSLGGIGVLYLFRRRAVLGKTPKPAELSDEAVPKGLIESAGDTFVVLLFSYCLAALPRRDMTWGDFIFIQVQMFLYLKVLIPGIHRMRSSLKQQ